MMLIAGLTGTSGAGKGYLTSFFDSKDDILVIDTDALYHKMIDAPSATTDALVCEFGFDILNEYGGVDRKKLGAIVFSDKSKLERLNAIVHCRILEECKRIMADANKPIVIIDAPQLFESGFDSECDVIVAIVADMSLRIDRIMRRDKISREDAIRRISNQHKDDWFFDKCDIIIENNSGDLCEEAQSLYFELVRLYGEKEKKEAEAQK